MFFCFWGGFYLGIGWIVSLVVNPSVESKIIDCHLIYCKLLTYMVRSKTLDNFNLTSFKKSNLLHLISSPLKSNFKTSSHNPHQILSFWYSEKKKNWLHSSRMWSKKCQSKIMIDVRLQVLIQVIWMILNLYDLIPLQISFMNSYIEKVINFGLVIKTSNLLRS